MGKLLLKVVIMGFLMAVSVGGVIVLKNNIRQKPTPVDAKIRLENLPPPTAIPGPLTSIPAPNGKAELTMTSKKIGGNVTWSINVGDTEIHNETLPSGVVISLPYNTFSPDNKYIFIKEEGPDITSFKVIKVAPNDMGQHEISEVLSAFGDKHKDFIVTDITGWGDVNLMILNTDKLEGGKGPSFWYNVNTKNFTRLATRFD